MNLWRLWWCGFVALWLAGCAIWRPLPNDLTVTFDDHQCLAAFEKIDLALARSGLVDGEGTTLRDLPFLRTDRFLASFSRSITDEEARAEWLAALSALDVQARIAELANLAGVYRGVLPTVEFLDRCRTRLTRQVAGDSAAMNSAVATQVPDEYRDWQRWLGLYPVAARLARAGIRRLHRDHPVSAETPSSATHHTYHSLSPPVFTPALDWGQVPRDALGRPRLSAQELAQLTALLAPKWSVATDSVNDRIGRAKWEHGRVVIDPTDPVMYHYSSFTRFAGRVLLQLNYVIWLPARPVQGAFDLLAGNIDGLTWARHRRRRWGAATLRRDA